MSDSSDIIITSITADKLSKPVTIVTQAGVVLAIAGALILALRHPENNGLAAKLQAKILDTLGMLLARGGVMTQEEFDQFKAGEITAEISAEGPADMRTWN